MTIQNGGGEGELKPKAATIPLFYNAGCHSNYRDESIRLKYHEKFAVKSYSYGLSS